MSQAAPSAPRVKLGLPPGYVGPVCERSNGDPWQHWQANDGAMTYVGLCADLHAPGPEVDESCCCGEAGCTGSGRLPRATDGAKRRLWAAFWAGFAGRRLGR